MDIIIVGLNGTPHTFTVQPHDTVGSLKSQIQAKLGHSSRGQRLLYDNGARTPLNDDSRALSSYGLQHGSRVSLLLTQPATVQVFLKNEKNQTTTYDVKPDQTVDEFKREVHKREGVPESQQRLIHEGKDMASGYKLADYNVREMSTIYLTFRLRGG
ncbi:ubiquitin-like protein ISG15 [Menidia menidia]